MNDVENEQDGKKKSFLSPSRILLWVVALAGVGLIAMELPPKNAYQSTYNAISERLPSDEELDEDKVTDYQPFAKSGIDEIISGSPTRSASPDGRTETFTWKSLLKTYAFKVQYDRDDWVMSLAPVE